MFKPNINGVIKAPKVSAEPKAPERHKVASERLINRIDYFGLVFDRAVEGHRPSYKLRIPIEMAGGANFDNTAVEGKEIKLESIAAVFFITDPNRKYILAQEQTPNHATIVVPFSERIEVCDIAFVINLPQGRQVRTAEYAQFIIDSFLKLSPEERASVLNQAAVFAMIRCFYEELGLDLSKVILTQNVESFLLPEAINDMGRKNFLHGVMTLSPELFNYILMNYSQLTSPGEVDALRILPRKEEYLHELLDESYPTDLVTRLPNGWDEIYRNSLKSFYSAAYASELYSGRRKTEKCDEQDRILSNHFEFNTGERVEISVEIVRDFINTVYGDQEV